MSNENEVSGPQRERRKNIADRRNPANDRRSPDRVVTHTDSRRKTPDRRKSG